MTKAQIKQLRRKLGMSQQAFADAIRGELKQLGIPGGCSLFTVSRWERGLQHPDEIRQAAIARLSDAA